MNQSPVATEQFVGERAPDVATVMIEGEAILLDDRGDRSHVLNGTGALVWQCFDGAATLHEICGDISEVLGIAYDQVFADTSAITGELIESGVVVAANAESAPQDPEGDEDPRQRYREYLDLQFPLRDEGVLAARAGDRDVVLRANDGSMLELLRCALAPSVVEGGGGPADVSLLFGEQRGRVRGSHFLYAGDRLLLHTMSEGRLLRAAIRYASGTGPTPPDAVRVRSRLLQGANGAILVTSAQGPLPDLNGRRAARLGWRVVDVEAPLLDVESGEVMLQASPLEVDLDALGEIDRRFPPEPGESTSPSMRTSVAGLVVLSSDKIWRRADSQARRAAALLPFVDTTDLRTRVDALHAITRVATDAPVRFLPEWQEHALTAILSPTGLRGQRGKH